MYGAEKATRMPCCSNSTVDSGLVNCLAESPRICMQCWVITISCSFRPCCFKVWRSWPINCLAMCEKFALDAVHIIMASFDSSLMKVQRY